MTVAELIGKLSKCPQDAKVFTSDNEMGHMDDPSVYLLDAFFGSAYSGGSERWFTEERDLRDRVPNRKAVVISHFYEDGERL